MIKKYDNVKQRRDLERWLKYVNMSEDKFDYICNTFSDLRVWHIEEGKWFEDNIWGGSPSYGDMKTTY